MINTICKTDSDAVEVVEAAVEVEVDVDKPRADAIFEMMLEIVVDAVDVVAVTVAVVPQAVAIAASRATTTLPLLIVYNAG